jgi:hypothetical protein
MLRDYWTGYDHHPVLICQHGITWMRRIFATQEGINNASYPDVCDSSSSSSSERAGSLVEHLWFLRSRALQCTALQRVRCQERQVLPAA